MRLAARPAVRAWQLQRTFHLSALDRRLDGVYKATLIAERGDQSSLMFQQPAASGTYYVGRNESIREHQGKSIVVWGYQAPEMTCQMSK